MKAFRKTVQTAALALLLALLSGCSLAGFLLSGWGWEDADLIFYNDSGLTVGSVGVSLTGESQEIRAAKEGTGLERGESWGFSLPEDRDSLVIEVFDLRGRSLARGRCGWPGQGERLWAVYDGEGGLRFSWNGEGR